MILFSNIAVAFPYIAAATTALTPAIATGIGVVASVSIIGFLGYQAFKLYKSLEAQIIQLKADSVLVNGQITSLTSDISTLQAKNIDLQKDLDTRLKKDKFDEILREINEDFAEVGHDIELLEYSVTEDKKNITDLTEDSIKFKKRFKTFKEQLETSYQRYSKLDTRVTASQKLQLGTDNVLKKLEGILVMLSDQFQQTQVQFSANIKKQVAHELVDIQTKLNTICVILDEYGIALMRLKGDVLDTRGKDKEPITPIVDKLQHDVIALKKRVARLKDANKSRYNSAADTEEESTEVEDEATSVNKENATQSSATEELTQEGATTPSDANGQSPVKLGALTNESGSATISCDTDEDSLEEEAKAPSDEKENAMLSTTNAKLKEKVHIDTTIVQYSPTVQYSTHFIARPNAILGAISTNNEQLTR